MEINVTNTAAPNKILLQNLFALLSKFKSDSFAATIQSAPNKNTFFAQTQFGTLRIVSEIALKKGDKLTLKVNKSIADAPTLDVSKIERPFIKPIPSNASTTVANKIVLSNAADIMQIPSDKNHFVAKIIDVANSSVKLQDLQGLSFSLAKEHFKKAGINPEKQDFMVIKHLPNHKSTVEPINKEQLLQQVQRQLLPKQASREKPAQPFQHLSKAAITLFQALDVKPKLEALKHVSKEASTSSSQQSILPTKVLSTKSLNNLSEPPVAVSKAQKASTTVTPSLDTLVKETTVLLQQKRLKEPFFQPAGKNLAPDHKPITERSAIKQIINAVHRIKSALVQLLSHHNIKPDSISAQQLKTLFTGLELISKQAFSSSKPPSIINEFTSMNEALEKLLNDIAAISAKDKKQRDDDFLNHFKALIAETKQTVEQGLNKLLFQSTSAKLNQESTNTLLINTQIPLEINHQTKEVAVTIKQQKSSPNEEETAWEIHLSLEMGDLGLIGTKIMLKAQTHVSIVFWAELASTKALLMDKKDIFKQQMLRSGFILDGLNILLGKLEHTGKLPRNLTEKPFIDINV